MDAYFLPSYAARRAEFSFLSGAPYSLFFIWLPYSLYQCPIIPHDTGSGVSLMSEELGIPRSGSHPLRV